MTADVDMDLQWEDFLDQAHYNVPLHALRRSVVKQLALFLDRAMNPNERGITPDFGGLAELIGFNGLEVDAFERAESHTKQLIDEWKNREDLEPTVGRLVKFLAELGREDVLTDLQEAIRKEVLIFLNRPEQFKKQAPIQDETVSQGPGYEETPKFVTRHDVLLGREVKYDAFICYNPVGKDLDFVRELIKRFEQPPYSFSLFVPHRDDLAGLNAHNINAKIISERCRHMIVVLSPNFLESPACEFQSTFAHALSPGARNKRIVPIKIEDCGMPNILRIMACCDFTKRDLWDWSWDRLAQSIKVPLSQSDFEVESSRSMQGLISSENIDLPSAVRPSSEQLPFSSSPKESGFSSLSHSGSRSSSPASQPRTEPIPCSSARAQRNLEPMDMGSPVHCTAPVRTNDKKKPNGFKNFFSGTKKQKTKGKVADSQC